QNILNEIQRADLQLQRTYTTAIDLHRIIDGLIRKLQQRLRDKYFGNRTHEILRQLQEIDANKAEEFKESFELFIKTVIEYIKSYYDDNVKLSDQIKLYISSKKDYDLISTIDRSDSVHDNDEDDDDIALVHKNQQYDEHVRSDHFWSYLLNINPKSTPNMKKSICYIFSIPCTNAYVETIFSHIKHAWSDYRNHMDIELVDAELKIRVNSDYPCAYMYKHLLSQPDVLTKIRTNEKYQQTKRRNTE
ncbi:unnamed protein product, partial [Rotaria socialis]